MSDETREELVRIEGLHPELWDRMIGHLRALAGRHDRPTPQMGYAPPVLTSDRAVMREAADSVERLRAEVTRLRACIAKLHRAEEDRAEQAEHDNARRHHER